MGNCWQEGVAAPTHDGVSSILERQVAAGTGAIPSIGESPLISRSGRASVLPSKLPQKVTVKGLTDIDTDWSGFMGAS
jgi:hypothetical protein